MKRITLMITGLMSFSTEADIEILWQDRINATTITAICVFRNEEVDVGSTYLMTTKDKLNSATTLVPFVDTSNSNNPTVRCKRKPD